MFSSLNRQLSETFSISIYIYLVYIYLNGYYAAVIYTYIMYMWKKLKNPYCLILTDTVNFRSAV